MSSSSSCIMYLVSCIMYHVSCIMYHVSCIMYHVSCIMYHVSCIMYVSENKYLSLMMFGPHPPVSSSYSHVLVHLDQKNPPPSPHPPCRWGGWCICLVPTEHLQDFQQRLATSFYTTVQPKNLSQHMCATQPNLGACLINPLGTTDTLNNH